jgi:colanic acid biosynthesis glycosyl transferase WcaI
MRILVCGINYAPELIGIGKYTSEMCAALVARGHEVKVVTAPPYYPAWIISPGYTGLRYRRETLGSVEVTRCPLYVPRQPSGGRRLLHHASFAASSGPAIFRRARSFKPDVLFAIAPSLVVAPFAYVAARVSGAASWLHMQDFEIDAAFDLGLLSNIRIKQLALAIERRLLRSFDRVSSISPAMVGRLQEKGVEPARVVELRNWVDTSAVVPGQRMTSYRAALGISEHAVVALYAGNMAVKQGLESIAEAAKSLAERSSNVAFLLCGAGPMRASLERATSGLSNVRFLDLQPSEMLPELLATADIHLLPQRAKAADLVLPSKLAGALASGRPIVAMAAPGTGLEKEVRDAGIAVPPGNNVAFANAIEKLAKDPESRERLGTAARLIALKRWDTTKIINELEKTLLQLVAVRNQ